MAILSDNKSNAKRKRKQAGYQAYGEARYHTAENALGAKVFFVQELGATWASSRTRNLHSV